MEYFAHIDGISKEIKEYYQQAYIAAPERWERKGRTWTFYGWESQLETLAYLERAARERRARERKAS